MKNRILVLGALVGLCWTSGAVRAQQNVVVVLDDSGSMEDRMRTQQGRVQRIDVAKSALLKILSDLPPETRVGVLTLNSRLGNSNWIIPFGTGDRETWRASIERIRAQGGTPLGQFMKMGADRLLEARQNSMYGTYRLLVVTDGEATDENLLNLYLPDILSRGLTLDVIGVDMQSDHSLATRVHNYRRADDEASLQQALAEVFAEASSAGQDAEVDFEMLAALPDEFAEGALQALAKRGNAPIQGVDAEQSAGFRGNSSRRTGSGGSVPGASGAAIGGLFCCLAGLGLGVVTISLILASRQRGRRR